MHTHSFITSSLMPKLSILRHHPNMPTLVFAHACDIYLHTD